MQKSRDDVDLRPSDTKEMRTGRDAADSQMKALRQAHGTPVRQATLPPYISKWQLPGESD